MMQQETWSARTVQQLYVPQTEKMNVLAYRSAAVITPSEADIRILLRTAQSRNKAEGLSGVLVYDRGSYFQWLEGPTESLARVWHSILHDPRHCQIEVLRDEPISDRLFEGWDLRVVVGATGIVDAAVAAMDSSSTEFRRVIGKPKSIIDLSLEDVLSSMVIPRLREVHGRDAYARVRNPPTAALWHAALDSGANLAKVLLSSQSSDSQRYIDSLLEQGANLNALYHEVFEPAQLHLGKLWDDDQCDDFHLTLGLARLQLEIQRVNAALPVGHLLKSKRSVLLCAQPHEPHSVGLCMSSEMFNRKGWDVDCEFPNDNQCLNDLLHANWFDVLKVSQSGSLRRDSRLASMRDTIESARAASLNPALIVMVDGRTFVERPQIYRAVHANAMSASSLDAVAAAERLLQNSRSVTALCQTG